LESTLYYWGKDLVSFLTGKEEREGDEKEKAEERKLDF